MKIRTLELQHFRKFAQPMRLTGLQDGVNVLAECNEFGKSTILDAIRGVLFERHTSRARGVEGMRTWSHSTSPEVALEFEIGDETYRIEKRFLREPYARLRMPNGSLHEGEAAEERLQQLLGFRKPGNRGSQQEDHGMWGALWVTQLDSTRLPELPDYARQTVHSCLESEVSALTGGLRGQKFLTLIERDLAALVNGRGQPAGAYKQVLDERTKAAERMAKLAETQGNLQANIQSLDIARKRLQTINEALETNVAEQEIAEARQKRDAAQRFDDAERLALQAIKLSEGRVAELQTKAKGRTALKKQASEAALRQEKAEREEKSAADLLGRSESALTALQTRLETASSEVDRASMALRDARLVNDTVVAFAELGRLEARLAAADAAQEKVNAQAARLAGFTVSKSSVEAAAKAESALEQLKASLGAQATQISFDLLPDAKSTVQVNGVEAPATLSVVLDTTVSVAGVGTITIRPVIKDRTVLLVQIGEAERQLRSALSAFDVETLAQAREQLANREVVERDLGRAQDEVRMHTPADVAAGLDAGVEALRNQITAIRQRSREASAVLGLEELPALEHAREQVRLAQAAEQSASEELSVARAPDAVLQKRFRDALSLHSEQAGELATASRERVRLGEELARELVADPQLDISEQQSEALNRLAAQEQQLMQLRETRPVDTVALMDARIARYEKMHAERRDERSKLIERIALLQSQVDQGGGLGLDEELESERRKDEGQSIAQVGLEREIQVLRLLKDELTEAERAAKERYMAPLIQRMTPYLQTLFPGAAIHLDEDFQVTGVMRQLAQLEEFGNLSWGTQEQIAVLTRLAFADMLLDTGKPAMLILDDALAYSDPERLERMFDLLTQVSFRLQILVLTCREEVFTRLGGHRVELVKAA